VSRQQPDRTLDNLLDLDGVVLVVDPAGKHWVRLTVNRVPPTPERPQGIAYSLTLHDASGERLVGFDNAHPVRPGRGPSGRARRRQDHRHRLGTVRPYDYTDAATLLADFWAEVDAMLKERGVIE
jgi:hypothetical protein